MAAITQQQKSSDDTGAVLEEVITEIGSWPAKFGMDNGTEPTAHAVLDWCCIPIETAFIEPAGLAERFLRVVQGQLQSATRSVS